MKRLQINKSGTEQAGISNSLQYCILLSVASNFLKKEETKLVHKKLEARFKKTK